MSKEITYYVIDLSSSMGQKSDDGTELESGLTYFYDSVINKIIKGRKTDYISIITCHSPTTNNPFSESSDSFEGINVICNKIVPTYSGLKEYRDILVPNPNSNDQQGDCLQAMLVAVGLMQTDLKLKFIRNIVVVTNGEDSVPSFDMELSDSSVAAINNNNINVLFIGIDFQGETDKSQLKLQNQHKWTSLIQRYNNGHLVDAHTLDDILKYVPPLKRTKPVRSFEGELRINGDLRSLVKDGNIDEAPISFNVEVYPAARGEKLPNSHQYYVSKSGKVEKLSSEINHFITVYHDTEDLDGDGGKESAEMEKIDIAKDQSIPGFKYSNYDLITMDERIKQSAALPVAKSMDIIGFIKTNHLPLAFYTSESNYVLPKSEGAKDMVGYSSFCQALVESEVSALVRYVAKDGSEVMLCALNPCKIKIESQAIYGLQMVRLPFKEDEKMGRFPNLIKTEDEPKEEDIENDDFMEKFILAKDLDTSTIKPEIYAQEEVFIDNEKTNLISNQAISNDYQTPIRIESKLSLHSPAIRKFNYNMVKIIQKSLQVDSLNEFLNHPEFVTKYMATNQTNLFNMSNVTRKLEDDHWLVSKNEKAFDSAKKLAKIVKPYKLNRVKRGKEENYSVRTSKGVVEVEDEPLDIEDLLA